jgi:Uma2 family endonuclease
MTAEDFAALPESRCAELVRGEVVQVSPANSRHGDIAGNLVILLKRFVREHGLGAVLVEGGFIVARDPDTVRGPDVAFVRRARLQGERLPETFFPGPPDLAIEIVSPGDKAVEVQEKVSEYLAAGTEEVWVAYPKPQLVQVFTGPAPGAARVLAASDTLETPLLVGLALRVADIFE